MKNNSDNEKPRPMAPNISATRRDLKSTTSNVPLVCFISELVTFVDSVERSSDPGIW